MIQQWQAALDKNPQDINALQKLAEANALIGRWDAAVDYYRRAVLASGGNVTLIRRFVEIQIAATNGQVTEEAMKGLILLESLDNQDVMVRFYRGLAASQAGEPALQQHYWQGLAEKLPANHPWREMVEAFSAQKE